MVKGMNLGRSLGSCLLCAWDSVRLGWSIERAEPGWGGLSTVWNAYERNDIRNAVGHVKNYLGTRCSDPKSPCICTYVVASKRKARLKYFHICTYCI